MRNVKNNTDIPLLVLGNLQKNDNQTPENPQHGK